MSEQSFTVQIDYFCYDLCIFTEDEAVIYAAYWTWHVHLHFHTKAHGYAIQVGCLLLHDFSYGQ